MDNNNFDKEELERARREAELENAEREREAEEARIRRQQYAEKERLAEQQRREQQQKNQQIYESEKQQSQDNVRTKQKKKGSKLGYFLSGLIGVIVGSLLVWTILPSVSDSLPTTSTSNTPKVSTEQVSTDVTTNVTDAVDKAKEAVVGISNIQKKQSAEDIFGNSAPTSEGEAEATGSGSGVVYKKADGKAYIVTNNHVVEDADELEVTLASGKKVKAELVGTDPWMDLAVIKMDEKYATTVTTFGDSDKLKQGETVIAIGNPLGLDLYGSVTTGVISGKDRTVPMDINGDGTADWNAEVLQTDAAINPGNSGGALINLAGQTIGINSMKISEDTVEGLGFSIPINSAIPIIEQLEANGTVERPAMGVSLVDLKEVPAFYQKQTLNLPTDVTEGVVIAQVEEGSAADEAGIEQYDVVVEMDGEKVSDAIELRKVLYSKNVGDAVKLKVYRNGKIINKTVELKSTVKQ